MGNLPSHRVNEASPFEKTGVAFSGPINIKESYRRGRVAISKEYIAVFVCFLRKRVIKNWLRT